MTCDVLSLPAYEPDQLDRLIKAMEEDFWLDPPEDPDDPFYDGLPLYLLDPLFEGHRILVGDKGQRYLLMPLDEMHEMQRCAWAKVQRQTQLEDDYGDPREGSGVVSAGGM